VITLHELIKHKKKSQDWLGIAGLIKELRCCNTTQASRDLNVKERELCFNDISSSEDWLTLIFSLL
jgi:hypothetical protein